MTVLARGFLWKSRHGAPWFTDWHDFYSTELLMRSYQQWCDENRPYDRNTREQLGAFLYRALSRRNRPRGEHPVMRSTASTATSFTRPRGGRVAKTLDEIAIVYKGRPRGHQVGELVEARVRFTEMRDFVSPWEGNPDE